MAESQVGLVFRENEFGANPTLPFNSLALPAFDTLAGNPAHQVKVVTTFFGVIFCNFHAISL
jgi:hypothetical protein